MNIPASDSFVPVSLESVYNCQRSGLPDSLLCEGDPYPYGRHAFRGIPFEMGQAERANVLLLTDQPVTIELDDVKATYLLFLHVVEDRITDYAAGFADFGVDGNELGQHVSDYELHYADGSRVATPVLRRFAIQQQRMGWGASPFAAVPAAAPSVQRASTEEYRLKRLPATSWGEGEVRHDSGRQRYHDSLWIYALPNPHPEKTLQQIVCVPGEERSAIFALSHTRVQSHPLRPGLRNKVHLTLPPGVKLNALGEVDDIAIDLGTVIAARAALDYDRTRWLGDEPDVQPQSSQTAVIVDYAAHPAAKLYVGDGAGGSVCHELSGQDPAITAVETGRRPVEVHIVEKGSDRPVAARLHLHGSAGEYLPPRGHHRKVNPEWFEDNYGEFVNSHNQYAYVDGHCEVDLPFGEVFVEVKRGYEVAPLRTILEITPETGEVRLELDRVLHWREKGWVTADTHVHFLSPQTALLEGAAEGVNVVNLLASQWGEMYSNVADFDGKSTLGATDFGGDGEFLVRVGTENRMQVLGHVSLLGYSGAMIHPLCTGGPSESAIGDAQEVTMAEWMQRCIDQQGLVVMPHGPNPQCERAADIVLGLVQAMEMMTFNPHDQQINPYGIADWYRYLNLGYQVPVVGGSDKMMASALLGGVRTYTHLGERAFTYENWMAAVKAGNTFVTVGPLAEMTVAGQPPGTQIALPPGGGTVDVAWRVESVSVPIERVEVVVGGLIADQVQVDNQLQASGTASIFVGDSTWVALRVRGSYKGEHGEIAAHTSAVQLRVDGKPPFVPGDAMKVLEQIEGAIAYVDTLAPRPEALRYKQLRATLEAAHNRLHQQMHRNGLFHDHTPLHDHAVHREH